MGFLIFCAIILAVIIWWVLNNILIIIGVIVAFFFICAIVAHVGKGEKEKKAEPTAQSHGVITAPLTGSCKCDNHEEPQAEPASNEVTYLKKVWTTPDVDILEQDSKIPGGNIDDFKPDGLKIVTTLFELGVPVDVVDITVAPSSVSYHFDLINLAHHRKVKTTLPAIDMALNKETIMIDSNIAHFAINVNRDKREFVTLKTTMLYTGKDGVNHFTKNRKPTLAALGMGKEQVIADIAKMPHLLIAGTTGSGKSVCIHSIISSMLFNASPLSLGFVMIDPKQTELNVYDGMPHLLQPIVTDTNEAIIMLKKMCAEMDRRYSEMKEGKTFHSKIVIVIDELADLMMTSGKEVEKYICRIAQMGRACGMHLIVATQNPKADIVTTLIRGNLPARIIFKVAEKAGEKVLDMPGATKLTGKGDGIFKDPSKPSDPIRFQSAYICEDDIKRIVDYWKSPAALRASTLV